MNTRDNHVRSHPPAPNSEAERKTHCQARIVNLSTAILAAILTGCASLPDVGPFVDASNQLRSAVATSGATVQSELRLMPGGEAFADQLENQWQARDKAFAGLAAYASSLQGIVDAGNDGAASAQRVADSVAGLAGAAGVALPGSPEAIATATDIAKFLSVQIATARAAKSLEESLQAAQPAIEAISVRIAADLKDIEEIFIAASTATENAVRTSDEFKDLIGYRNNLLRQISQADPADPDTAEHQVQLGQMLQASDEWHANYLAQRKAIQDRLRLGRALIQAATQSARDWGIAHGALLTALQERRPVNIASLVHAAEEIQILVRKVREI